jgi:hypothetical protein
MFMRCILFMYVDSLTYTYSLSTLNTLDDPMYQILDQTGNDQPDAFKSLANHECNKTGYTRARTSSNNKPKSDAEINLAM